MNRKFLNLSRNERPILAVLHPKGVSDEGAVRHFKEEVAIYAENGAGYIIVENYFGDYRHMGMALDYVSKLNLVIPYDMNCLNVDPMGLELAEKYGAGFIQLDSVVGHVKPCDETTLGAFLKLYRERYQRMVLDGVRFRYQPALSQNSIKEDLQIVIQQCDAICATQDATGQETSLDRIIQFRNGTGDFPLIVGTGVIPKDMAKQFAYADGAVVGSYFKDSYRDEGGVSQEHVREIVKAVQKVGGRQYDKAVAN